MSDSTPPRPAVPPPSIGHELGVMFGFIALMLLTAGLYVTVWQLGQRRSARKERERREELSARGFGGEKEKGVDRGFGGDGDRDRDVEDGMA